ncbi:hypothetical protein DVJ77_04605 [Dyella tabacisoli]|uniref:Uncharacterized protein n=2 Tax=Dyella tabacisoli TaxID=2282381 RepID=A0A369UR77_9GAMM|nr:hypothetical protein DVJ77_04605 [Dyella tabacisoli]
MKTPDIKQNPHPKTRYEITVTINDAPGPFDSVAGVVHYMVENDRCVPLTPISGATLAPEKNFPITFTRVSDNVYKGTIYADLLQDEDYYGLGVCHWAVNTMWATLKVKGVDFSPAMDLKEIVSQKPTPTYFVKADYFNTDKERSAFGTTNRSLFQTESSTDIFSMTLSAKEDFQ